ncbi:MAG: tetratricopeptide repeat protein [bacterium]|nr:tetratricopeptide repeat protein [bacterium]
MTTSTEFAFDWDKVSRVHTNYNEGVGHFITVITGDQGAESDSIIRQDVVITPEIKRHCEILKEISAQTKKTQIDLTGEELTLPPGSLNLPEQKKYRKRLRKVPNDTTARMILADSYLKTGKLRRAAKEFERIVSDDPSDVKANFRLGCIYLMKKKYLKAAQYLERTQQLSPQKSIIRRYLAYTYILLDRVEEAVKHYQRVLGYDPQGYEFYLQAITSLSIDDDPYPKVIAKFEEILKTLEKIRKKETISLTKNRIILRMIKDTQSGIGFLNRLKREVKVSAAFVVFYP